MEPRIKLLIADEDIKARNDIKEKLSHYHIDIVAETDNGIDIFSKIKKTSPDIVLIDIWLPKMDVIQIIKNFLRRCTWRFSFYPTCTFPQIKAPTNQWRSLGTGGKIT